MRSCLGAFDAALRELTLKQCLQLGMMRLSGMGFAA